LASDLEALGEDMPFGWESVWKDNCQTRCIDGKCNTILGKTIWVNDSDGTCKEIEKANSLKNGFYIEYLEKDPDFNLTVSEFNISYMDMTLDFVGNPADHPTFCQVTDALNAKCDFKLDEKWNEYDEEGNVTEKKQLKFQYKWELKQGVVTKGDKVKYEYKENVFGKKFSFGGNSTTIQLQDADTENLEDSNTYKDSPDNSYGDVAYIEVYSHADYRAEGYIKFNLSSVPSNQTLNNAMLYLMPITDTYSDVVNVYPEHNQIWTEETLTWNNRPPLNTTILSSVTTNGSTYIWLNWSVTSYVNETYTNEKNNISFRIACDDTTVYKTFRPASKEEAVTTRRLYLNITYSKPDSTPPTYSDNSTNSTIAGADILHSLKWEDNIGLSSYIFSFYNGSNISSCIGTLDCSIYSTEASCENCSQCNWTSGNSDYTNSECGNDCSGGDYTYPSTASCTDHILATACGGASSCDGTDTVVDIWLNGTTFKSTDMIGVTMGVMCYGTGDEIKIWYYNGSVWNEEFYDATCAGQGYHNITDSIQITSSAEAQTIRGQVTYGTLSGDDECYTGTYGDNDDINFTVVSSNYCSNDGSCSTCDLDECDTNCSVAGCSVQVIEFVNDTAVSFSGTINWSNVTKTVSSNVGDTIKWCVYANDTSDNWNSTSCENPFSYVTTSADTCNPTSPLTSDYTFDCNDNCTQDTTLNANGYNIIWNNAGNYYLEANIENVKNMTIANVCNFYKGNGNITMMKN